MKSIQSGISYNRSLYNEIHSIGANDMIPYKRGFLITEFLINGFDCIIIIIITNWDCNLGVQ